MNMSKKNKNLFIVLIAMITVNLLFQTRDSSELVVDLAIFTLGYFVLYSFLEHLVGSKTKSKKNSRN